MASIQDVFQYEAMKNINKSESQYLRLQEVLNYTNALDTCLKEIRNEDKRITLYTIKTAHKILISDVRGGDKYLVKFEQSKIGLLTWSNHTKFYIHSSMHSILKISTILSICGFWTLSSSLCNVHYLN